MNDLPSYPKLIEISLRLGIHAAIVTAWLYITGILAAMEFPRLFYGTETIASFAFSVLAAGLMIIVVGCVIGMTPSILIGMFTAWLMGRILQSFGARIGRALMLPVSFVICGLIALSCSALFWSYYGLSFNSNYMFVLGGPSILYILIGLWTGDRLQQELARMRARELALLARVQRAYGPEET
jgi:hypothetical protein